MTEKKMTAPVLAHRDGREKEHWTVLDFILPLFYTAVKAAAVMTGIYILVAAAALNIPAVLGSVLALNFLLGRLEVYHAQVHRTAAADAGPRRNTAGFGR